jgi:hypothetical protein
MRNATRESALVVYENETTALFQKIFPVSSTRLLGHYPGEGMVVAMPIDVV